MCPKTPYCLLGEQSNSGDNNVFFVLRSNIGLCIGVMDGQSLCGILRALFITYSSRDEIMTCPTETVARSLRSYISDQTSPHVQS